MPIMHVLCADWISGQNRKHPCFHEIYLLERKAENKQTILDNDSSDRNKIIKQRKDKRRVQEMAEILVSMTMEDSTENVTFKESPEGSK